jgi:hypothetical protein
MLPKPERSKKLTNLLAEDKASAESEAEVSQKRLLLKRRLILISLLMTAGVSFIFWSFRAAQKIIHQPPQFNFKLPRPNFSLKNNPSTHQTDIFVLSDSQSSWSVASVAKSRPDKPVFSHNYNDFNFNHIFTSLSSQKPSSSSLIDLQLPQGLTFQEKTAFENNSLIYQNLISLPSDTLLISVLIPQAQDLESVKSQLSSLVESLYWYSVRNLN